MRDWLFKALDRARVALRPGVGRDPITGLLAGTLRTREAIAAGRLTMGRHSYGDMRLRFGQADPATVSVGAFCSIAEGVEIFASGGEHRVDWTTTYPLRVRFGMAGALRDGHPRRRGDTTIGNDVWIGAGARILQGVTIGDGAVIGACAVVARDVRPYAIVVGNPAREVRRRFGDAQVEALLQIRWWEWPDERVHDAVDRLCGDVDVFIEAHR